MTIASQITALGNNIGAAYNMINQRGGTVPARKNAENMSTAIATIPSLGSVLWAGSAMSPTLVGNYTLNLNLATDTNYLNTTPSTSEQTVLAASTSSLTITGPTLDLTSKRYIIFEDIIVPHSYTTIPSGIAYTECTTQKFVYTLGRRYSTPTSTKNTAQFNNAFNGFANLYYNSAGTHYLSASTYGVYSGSISPTVSSSTSNTPELRFPNPAVRIRSNSGTMDLNAWQNLDASNTIIKVKWQVFSIDMPCATDTAAELLKDAALDGDFQDNLIMLGGNS